MEFGPNMGGKTPVGHYMIDHSTPKADSGSRKKLYLLLTGGGILVALALIVVGIVVFVVWRSQAVAEVETPTPALTPTAQPVADTPTVAINIEVRASATPPTIAASQSQLGQAAETAERLPTATRVPTRTPTPVAVQSGQSGAARVDGTIELVFPEHDTQVSGDQIEFKWIWHRDKGCLPPPDGFAFEVRVWQDMGNAAPMGAMDAGAEKPNIQCDPATGVRSFTVGKLQGVPGAAGQAHGRLRWDVALVQLTPYKPVITTQYRTFFY